MAFVMSLRPARVVIHVNVEIFAGKGTRLVCLSRPILLVSYLLCNGTGASSIEGVVLGLESGDGLVKLHAITLNDVTILANPWVYRHVAGSWCYRYGVGKSDRGKNELGQLNHAEGLRMNEGSQDDSWN